MLVTWHHTIFIGNGPSCNHSFTLLVALHKACATHSLVPYRTHFPNPLPRGPERRVTHDVPHSPQSSPRSPSFPSESLFLSITPPAVARTCWRTRWGAPCDAVGHTADISASHAPSLGPTGWRPGLEAGACLASTHFPRNSRTHVQAAFCLVPGPADRYRRPRPPNTRAHDVRADRSDLHASHKVALALISAPWQQGARYPNIARTPPDPSFLC